jgi:hypothetical protein
MSLTRVRTRVPAHAGTQSPKGIARNPKLLRAQEHAI